MQERKIFALSKLSKAIERVINTHCSSVVWVKAEIVKLNYYPHSGHAYPDLVEKKDDKIVAEMRGTIWKSQFNSINKKFREVLQEDLKDDMTVVIQAKVTYHSLYGLSLNIMDIDPEYTLGELARQKAETIRRLKKENLFTANKQQVLPDLPKTIAVISVESSKGYQDFLSVIHENPWGYRYHLKLFPAILQGDRAIPTIMQQLETIKKYTDVFDAVAIIRGGGGEIGLSCYDDYRLAKSIGSFPIPVLTGIGHSTNQTVSEIVSYQSFITPTKIAEFLLQEFHNFFFPIRENLDRLKHLVRRSFEREQASLKESTRLLQSLSKWTLEKNHNRLLQLNLGLQLHSKAILEREKVDLTGFATNIRLLSPENILKKGYSISRINAKLVQDLSTVEPDSELETQVYGGIIRSKIQVVEHTQDQSQTTNKN